MGRFIGRTASGLMDRNQQADVKKTQRNFIVFSTLICVLTLTSALLLALAPAPLAPDATSLFAITQPDSMDAVFQTHKGCDSGRWKFDKFCIQASKVGGSRLSLIGA